MALPDVVVAADFTSPPLSIPTDWTDITAKCRSETIRQGRQRILQRTEVGSATVTLDNRERIFDPTAWGWGASSWGSFPWGAGVAVRPGNHLRIQAVRNGITYDLFRGFVRSWPQEWPQKKDAVSRVQAEDLFALMARFELEGDAIAAERCLKGWSRAKKEALIAGDFDRLRDAARRRSSFGPHPSRRPPSAGSSGCGLILLSSC